MKSLTKQFTGNRRRSYRGASLLEMTACILVLMPLSFGAVEFGDAFFKKNTLQGAAREAARAAIVSGATTTTVQDAANAVMTAAGITNSPTVRYTIAITNTSDTTVNPATVAAGTAIKVTVSGTWRNLGIRPMGIIDANKTIRGSAVMRKES